MKFVYQIWYETSVGPTFSTEDNAINFLSREKGISVEEVKKNLETYWNGYGYPCIRKIKLDDERFLADR